MYKRQVIGWRLVSHGLLCLTFLFIGLFVAGGVRAANQGDYPDWATRWPKQELYEPDCRPLWIPRKYGPFDYRQATPDDRDLVERAHFSLEYDAYLKGQKRSSRQMNDLPVAGGFSYTLWSFPNHPRALAAMEDLGYRYKKENLPAGLLRVHCFFQRAARFAPDDALVRALYGYYYARRGKVAEANAQLEKIKSLDAATSSAYVYASFAYLAIKEYDKALEAAKQAYQLGYPLPGLRDRLKRLGKWHD